MIDSYVIRATDEEKAYSDGWNAYHNDDSIESYNSDNSMLTESFERGFNNAKLEDTSEK